jgi:hypothetical protein
VFRLEGLSREIRIEQNEWTVFLTTSEVNNPGRMEKLHVIDGEIWTDLSVIQWRKNVKADWEENIKIFK